MEGLLCYRVTRANVQSVLSNLEFISAVTSAAHTCMSHMFDVSSMFYKFVHYKCTITKTLLFPGVTFVTNTTFCIVLQNLELFAFGVVHIV